MSQAGSDTSAPRDAVQGPAKARHAGIRSAAAAFLTLALIGWLCGQGPFVCAKRALVGAAVAFVVARVLQRIIDTISGGPATTRSLPGSGEVTSGEPQDQNRTL